MTLPQAKPGKLSVEEYLRLEADSDERHDYWDGEIVSMAGGSPEHSLIIANIIREIGNALKGKPCRVYDSNLRIGLPRKPIYVYPDASIICDPLEFDPNDKGRQTVLNPLAVVEVASPGTTNYDHGKKFHRHLEIASFQEYVMVWQDEAFVETYFRRDDGTWLYAPCIGLDKVAKLQSVNVALPLEEIYRGVTFPPPVEIGIPYETTGASTPG